MSAERLLLRAVTMQRDGKSLAEIEAELTDLAKRSETGCHCRRNFAGHIELMFADGQCLRHDGIGWTLRQQATVAPLYADAMDAFAHTRDDHASSFIHPL